jgi:hypothetical protein
MDRRQFSIVLPASLASGLWISDASALSLTEGDAASGVRVALERGAVAAVGLLGRNDGFLGNPKVRSRCRAS